MAIERFVGKYEYLSTFHTCQIKYHGYYYNNAYSVYQGQKLLDQSNHVAVAYRKICAFDWKKAMQYRMKLQIRDDWSLVKESILKDIIIHKFRQNSVLAATLKHTQSEILYTTPDDLFWGIFEGKGLNKLGNILMQVRDEL